MDWHACNNQTTCTCLLLLQDINPSKSRQTCFDSQRGGRSVSSTKLDPMYYLISFHGNGDVKKKAKVFGEIHLEPRNLPTKNQKRCVLQCPLIYSKKNLKDYQWLFHFYQRQKSKKWASIISYPVRCPVNDITKHEALGLPHTMNPVCN